MGKPYNTFSPDTWYPPARLIEMSETMEPEELAEVTGISIEEVMTALAAVGRKSPRLGACDRKTGKFIEAERSMHGYLHITDPTLYRQAIHSDSLRQQIDLAKAAVAFVLAVQKVKDEIADATNA